MNPDSLLQFDRTHLWHPYATALNPPPVFPVVSAKGTRIRLADGQELIDAVSSWWCVAHGHNHPAVIDAIRRQSERMTHVMFAGFTHEPAVELAESLTELLPAGLERIFFADSGSIAVECAAKMAVQYQHALGFPKRAHLVALKGGYHGDTAGAMALSDPDGMHVLFKGIMPHHFFAERPNCRFDGEWIDSDFDSMLQVLDTHHDEIAAVIAEPVFQGGNGMWMYHPEYLRKLRNACDTHGILLILDEIATGFGRTGKMFAMQHADVVPDIVCVGKILSAGAITLGATVASVHVADVISSGNPGAFMHGPTYMANPLACAAGCASMKLVRESGYLDRVHRIESELKEDLEQCRDLPNVNDVRVLGAIGVLELNGMPRREDLQRIILEHGVWLRPFCSYVYTMPPFITTSEEIHRITGAMKALAMCECVPMSDDEFHE